MWGFDLLPNSMRLLEGWQKARSSGLTPKRLDNLKPGATLSTEVFRRGNLRLLSYAQAAVAPANDRSPIVVIPSLINRHYVLDLLPGRSLIERLTKDGFQVFAIEWLPPKPEDRFVTIDELYARRLSKALSVALQESSTGKLHLIGHCLGGTLAVIEALLRPERLASLTLLTAPIDFEEAGQIGRWIRSSRLDVAKMAEAHGNIPWPLLHGAFHFLRPSLPLTKAVKLAERWKDDSFLMPFLALEMWSNDSLSFPGQCHRFLIEELYERNSLSKGQLVVGGRQIDLANIDVPVLDVIALDDHIVLPPMRWPDEKTNGKVTRADLLGGHIGAILGGRAQKTFWPELVQWLKSQD